jgi:hypothetical protein
MHALRPLHLHRIPPSIPVVTLFANRVSSGISPYTPVWEANADMSKSYAIYVSFAHNDYTNRYSKSIHAAILLADDLNREFGGNLWRVNTKDLFRLENPTFSGCAFLPHTERRDGLVRPE